MRVLHNGYFLYFYDFESRRTDFENGFIQRYNLPELKPSYFLSAMDEYIRYVKTFDTMSKVPQYFKYFDHRYFQKYKIFWKYKSHEVLLQVVFLLVSDDMKWTKMNIYSRARSHYNIFLAGNGNGENVDAVGNLILSLLHFISI